LEGEGGNAKMVNKREDKGVKQEIVKSAMENEELVSFIKSLTKDEIKRIKATRLFEDLKEGTYGRKVAVLCDSIRSDIRKNKIQLAQRLSVIDSTHTVIQRLKQQLVSGVITEELKPGLKMTPSEVECKMNENVLVKDAEVTNIPVILANIRQYVGHMDVDRKIVMTEDEFEAFAADYEAQLKKRGYDLFKELL
jgi:hypothetical protein